MPTVTIPERIRRLIDEARPLGERFEAEGHHLYLVGGVVRDALLGRDLSDDRELDMTTDARPDEIRRILETMSKAVWDQGERFGTIGARIAGREVEITTHRAEVYVEDSRKPEVRFGDDIVEDLARRDFTVNAMALAVPEPQLIDPYDGAVDLAAGRLRTPLEPDVAFSEDPLRMLRAARFIAGYHLRADEELVESVERMASRLEIVSAERIRDEIDKLLMTDDPTPGLEFLVDTGLAEHFMPELTALRLEQDPLHHHKDVMAHTFAVVANTSRDRWLRLAALFHDVGKPATREIGPNGVSFHHHEVVGARMTRKRMRDLRYSNEDVEAVSTLVFLHLRFHTYQMGWTDSAVRRYVRDAGPLLDRLNELTRCDCTTRNRRKAEELSRRMDHLEARIAELAEQEELAALRPDLDGNAVMERLGLPPGPVVGEAMRFLMELRLDEGELGGDEAMRRLDAWWQDRQRASGGY